MATALDIDIASYPSKNSTTKDEADSIATNVEGSNVLSVDAVDRVRVVPSFDRVGGARNWGDACARGGGSDRMRTFSTFETVRAFERRGCCN